jgi:ABC-type multidrug transport system fused ATPase/permease subunit
MDVPMGSIKKILRLLTPRERRRLIPIILAVLTSSFLDLLSVGSLGPFMAVVVDPTHIQRQRVLAFIYQVGGFSSEKPFLIFLGAAVFGLVLAAVTFKMGSLYAVFRFAANRQYTLGLRLFKQYLYQPYRFFLNHNTSELSKSILSEVDTVIIDVLIPAMQTLVHGLITIVLLVFIIIMNPLLTMAAFGLFGVVYSVLYVFTRSKLSLYGKDLWEANTARYKTSAEAFGGIKDVKILGKEPFFVTTFGLGTKKQTTAYAASQILSILPSQAMQSLAIGFTIAMVIALLIFQGSFMQIVPTLAVYAFAIMRIVPGFQNTLQSGSQIRFYTQVVDTLYRDMTTLPSPPESSDSPNMDQTAAAIPITNSINLEQIEFSYPGSAKPVLREIDLVITKNTTISLVGPSGCGKTTLVDIIMGLLEPDAGTITADGILVIGSFLQTNREQNRETITRWQRNFGYVPQQIFLSDDTIAANIAFGIPEEMRDKAALERAARAANLHDFIMGELPNAYNTLVGERGIRLSGGQRQRVGIARSLYHDPNTLVMDEATSALDSVTEDAVMDAIHNLTHSKTIIIIAHRISTVRECDMICLMEKGCIVDRGTYNELIETNPHFRAMAKVKK